MYHISDLKKYMRCPIIYFNDEHAEKREYQPFVRLDEKITDLAMQKLNIRKSFIGERGDECTLAMEALKKERWLVKARFEYHDLRIKVPFLHRVKKGWDLYFLYTGIYPHGDDSIFYCANLWVLENLGIKIHKIRMIHLDAEYVRGDELDPDRLFVISDYLYNPKNNPTIPFEEHIRNRMRDFDSIIDEMHHFDMNVRPVPERKPNCTGRMKCRYHSTCFTEEKEEENNSILHLFCSQYRYQMKKEGILYLKDADTERIEGSRMQYAQIMADRNGGLFVDRAALSEWLSAVHYPISFLDFEWERFAVPPYKGMKPYDVLPFEYALYVLHEDGTMEYRVYLNVHDDRRNMAENLIKDIPDTGSVIAYNATGAEMIRIREFADLFPDLREKLLAINERMEDMQIPFMSGVIYDTRMKGQWSLKIIMSMMNDARYSDLDINQGMEAVYQWRHLDYDDETPAEEKEKIVEDLKKYCGMDAYAMTVVYKWMCKLLQEDR